MNELVLLLGHGHLAGWRTLPVSKNWRNDGTTYHNILSFWLPSGDFAAQQYRPRFDEVLKGHRAQIGNGDRVPAGKRVILDEVSVYCALAYTLHPEGEGKILDLRDALDMGVRWRLKINGVVQDYYNEAMPASGLHLAADPASKQRGQASIPLGGTHMGTTGLQSGQATVFSRSFDYLLPRPLLIRQNQDLQIPMRLPVLDVGCEYTAWAKGRMEISPD